LESRYDIAKPQFNMENLAEAKSDYKILVHMCHYILVIAGVGITVLYLLFN